MQLINAVLRDLNREIDPTVFYMVCIVIPPYDVAPAGIARLIGTSGNVRTFSAFSLPEGGVERIGFLIVKAGQE